MKKIFTILILIMLCFLSGCKKTQIEDTNEILTIKEVKYIQTVFDKNNSKELICGFFGEYNGAYVITGCSYLAQHQPWGSTGCWHEIVGEYTFENWSDFPLRVVYDEKIYYLSEAYEEGIINDHDLEDLYKKYTSIPKGNTFFIYQEFKAKNKDYVVLLDDYEYVLVTSGLPYIFVISKYNNEVAYVTKDGFDVNLINIHSDESTLTEEQYELLKTIVPLC